MAGAFAPVFRYKEKKTRKNFPKIVKILLCVVEIS
jgi:hypothetical protein